MSSAGHLYNLMKIYEPYFDPASHTYHDPAGCRLEGVTDILAGELGGYDGYPASAAKRGHDVHLACQLFDEGTLEEDKLTEEIYAYVQCYKAALKFYGIKVLQNEVRRYHPLYKYAGTCDKPAIIGGLTGIADLKSGVVETWHKWQDAAYWKMLVKEIPNLTALWTLYIKPGAYENGRGFNLVTHDNPERLFSEFLALFTAYTIKKNNKYIRERRNVV